MEEHPIEEIVERWEGLPIFASQPHELREAMRPGRLSHDPRSLASLLRTAGQGVLPDVWERLPHLPVPTLLVAGESDDAYVDAAYRMAEAMPRATARLIPGSGHAPQLEAPDSFVLALREFLDGLADPAI
jgi:2-succinyl-6-hydroxy-2,4-cyclohexadiene-1-carboxylate synthase